MKGGKGPFVAGSHLRTSSVSASLVGWMADEERNGIASWRRRAVRKIRRILRHETCTRRRKREHGRMDAARVGFQEGRCSPSIQISPGRTRFTSCVKTCDSSARCNRVAAAGRCLKNASLCEAPDRTRPPCLRAHPQSEASASRGGRDAPRRLTSGAQYGSMGARLPPRRFSLYEAFRFRSPAQRRSVRQQFL